MVKPISGSSNSSQLRGEEEERRSSLSPRNDQSSSSCKYKGVRKRKWGKWVSEIRLPNSRERIWLGSYDSPEKAARAFDAALFCLRGHTAKFNFPDAPPQIPGGRTLSSSEIQLAASRFANSSVSIPPAAVAENNSSPCGSWSAVSEGTVQLEGSFGELTALDDSETPQFMGSGYFDANYGIFPGFDDLDYHGFIASPSDQVSGGGADHYGEEGGFGPDDYSNCLWNF